MELGSTAHLRAWLLEELEFCLQAQSESTLVWAEQLAANLWRELPLEELILEISFILPPAHLEHFIRFAVNNYPRDFSAALATALQHAACNN